MNGLRVDFLAVLAVFGFPGWAVSAGPGGVVLLSMRDSRTGVAVAPESLLVNGQEWAAGVEASGKARLVLPAGQHVIHVRAGGYAELATRQMVADGREFLNIVLLDPLEDPPEMRPQNLRRLLQPGSAVVAGFVVDDETGRPIQDAEISVPRAGASALTDERGFFSVPAPLPDGISAAVAELPIPATSWSISKTGYRTQRWREVLLLPGESRVFQVRLRPGAGEQVIADRASRGRLYLPAEQDLPVEEDGSDVAMPLGEGEQHVVPMSTQAAPDTIRVGRTGCCSAPGECTSVLTVSMETYVKHVLPAEWFASWRPESLKAGAVAIRSYGGWHVYNPRSPNSSPAYDICDTSCCQVYGTSTDSRTNAAVDATAGMYMVSGAGNIGRAEYSAENNDLDNRDGCGDCYTQNRPNDGICLHDWVCCGQTQRGHGRGMCQWGTQRWALNQGQTFEWMCAHYYSAYGWTLVNLGAPPTITQHPAPLSICPGQTGEFTVAATGPGVLTYQWQRNQVNLAEGGRYSGVATPMLTVSQAEAADIGNYRCVVSNGGGNTPSNAAALSLDGPEFAPADFDRDGDVDQEDFAHFQKCLTGEDIPQHDPACLNARLDDDQDVDKHDFAIFHRCMSGPNNPADRCCAAP